MTLRSRAPKLLMCVLLRRQESLAAALVLARQNVVRLQDVVDRRQTSLRPSPPQAAADANLDLLTDG